MTDEMFRDGFCDDIFRSMKMQMEPSDDVVGSLLAKIAAEASSPVTESDNVIQFRQPAEIKADRPAAAIAALAEEVESTPRKHIANSRKGKNKNKSIWYYGTAVAASIIVMISTFALLDTDGDDASGMQDLFQQAVGPNTQIADQQNPGDETQIPDDGAENIPLVNGDEENSSDIENQDVSGGNEGSENSADTQNAEAGEPEKNTSGEKTSADTPDKTGSKEPAKEENGKDSGKDSHQNTSGGQTSEKAPEIPWTNEIIGNSQVASISVSGGNYVVGSTVPRSDVGETLEVVTIELPQTSTTSAGAVKAKVREIKKVSSEAIVALDVEGFEQPLIYANADYAPSTLGKFVSDLNLEGNTAFSGTVRCQISKVGYSSSQNYSLDISQAAWTYVLNQKKAERADYSNFSNGTVKVMFTSTDNPAESQIQFGVSDTGYLYISMLGQKHTFHIGSENAKGFIEYVTGEPLE